MLVWLEYDQKPTVCENCKETDCDLCDHVEERWVLTKKLKLEIEKKKTLKVIEDLQSKVMELDNAIAKEAERERIEALRGLEDLQERLKDYW